MNMLGMFQQFKADRHYQGDMYVSGKGGTGKTTDLAHTVQHCIDESISYIVCAFTHEACGVLRSKLPENANVRTLHSFLKKRPGINQHATNSKQVQCTIEGSDKEVVEVVFIDEYSMTGEKDLMSLRDAQDIAEEAGTKLQLVWLGDSNQLPAVGDKEAIVPGGKYNLKLTKCYRTAEDNPLTKPLDQLITFIEGTAPVAPLVESEKLVRQQDILEWYKNDNMADDANGVLLAFTNKRVEELNAMAQGYGLPKPGDRVCSPNLRESYKFIRVVPPEEVYQISKSFGEPLLLGTKFKTLEYIRKQSRYTFVELLDDEGELHIFCTIFGHYQYKIAREELMNIAAGANAVIEKSHNGAKAAQWCRDNNGSPLAKGRGKAWRDYLSFNECCVCLDFTHAKTVHKSQGKTYKTVYADTQDIGIAADMNYRLYLRLLYVALSRASDTVVTN